VQGKIIPYAMFASWIVYLFCFPLLSLGDAPPYVWLLAVATLMGIAATGQMSFTEKTPRALFLAAVVLLFLMYGVQWVDIVLSLGRAMPADSTVGLFGFMISTKARLVASLVEKRELIHAVQQAYWEIMPILQILLVSVWVIVRRSTAHSGTPA
jgi:hypothetical protein